MNTELESQAMSVSDPLVEEELEFVELDLPADDEDDNVLTMGLHPCR